MTSEALNIRRCNAFRGIFFYLLLEYIQILWKALRLLLHHPPEVLAGSARSILPTHPKHKCLREVTVHVLGYAPSGSHRGLRPLNAPPGIVLGVPLATVGTTQTYLLFPLSGTSLSSLQGV